MEETVSALHRNLSEQLSSLANQIREAESNLLRLKENYLKVQGALEAVSLIRNEMQQQETEAVAEVLS